MPPKRNLEKTTKPGPMPKRSLEKPTKPGPIRNLEFIRQGNFFIHHFIYDAIKRCFILTLTKDGIFTYEPVNQTEFNLHININFYDDKKKIEIDFHHALPLMNPIIENWIEQSIRLLLNSLKNKYPNYFIQLNELQNWFRSIFDIFYNECKSQLWNNQNIYETVFKNKYNELDNAEFLNQFIFDLSDNIEIGSKRNKTTSNSKKQNRIKQITYKTDAISSEEILSEYLNNKNVNYSMLTFQDLLYYIITRKSEYVAFIPDKQYYIFSNDIYKLISIKIVNNQSVFDCDLIKQFGPNITIKHNYTPTKSKSSKYNSNLYKQSSFITSDEVSEISDNSDSDYTDDEVDNQESNITEFLNQQSTNKNKTLEQQKRELVYTNVLKGETNYTKDLSVLEKLNATSGDVPME